MDNNQDKHIQKTKEEKEAFKAQKKLEKEKRKEKTLQKCDKKDVPQSSNQSKTGKMLQKGDKNDSPQSSNLNKMEKPLQKGDKDDLPQSSNQSKIASTKRPEIVSNKTESVKTAVVSKTNVNLKSKPKIDTVHVQKLAKKSERRNWYSNLFQPVKRLDLIENARSNPDSEIHPEFIKFATEIDNGKAQGSTLRCRLFLEATKQMIMDMPVDGNKSLSRTFTTLFDKQTEFINQCRPLSVTMRNAIKYLKSNSSIVTETDNEKCRNKIIAMIDQFLQDRIEVAQNNIETLLSKHLRSGINVLVYSYSELVFKSLVFAWNELESLHKSKFQVFIVESFPDDGGDRMKKKLNGEGIPSVALQLCSVHQIMKQIDLVLLGAHCILTNNSIVGQSGMASITVEAKTQRVPVVVCAETYKFYARGPGDGIEINELGCPDRLVRAVMGSRGPGGDQCDLVTGWRKGRLVTPVDLLYDTVSHHLVTMVCCELGAVSPTTASFVTHLKEPLPM